MNEIIWPEGYLPGMTDNFVSNEIIIADLSAAQVWKFLYDTSKWESYYSNVADIRFHNVTGPELSQGAHFRFTTFEFPIEAEVLEYDPPADGKPARLAWHGWEEGSEEDSELQVHHAWLLEDLPGGRVRILTQETQKGKAAQEMAVTKPNPMLNGHQEWIVGLAEAASQQKRF
ncbi:SRPBCC domain-containing protein [Domibacillus sp. DTU_2020_1001157_1_SI_ALB_TIR_016]|uniref:SRPBCC domain-containing protein n=1 Tax=Domibacillus sp. DTU_2020_1001157_1_SI_ALB_TIR_016 TaxID=3077789 RepID=UPI0028E7F438|nr:SRPBCC domain-containing protein [Domibacillus sp. DTU_2020_1001157_1_SI_ALB_TIR_016]WNS77773.1 SRPBCC domain-containing protein [Domibacillus sp. DTU_2020_1001157_1_SI_ALB_TIR_016]